MQIIIASEIKTVFLNINIVRKQTIREFNLIPLKNINSLGIRNFKWKCSILRVFEEQI